MVLLLNVEMQNMSWTEDDFAELAEHLTKMGVNPDQIRGLNTKNMSFEADLDPGQIFLVIHQLSGALEQFYREELGWVDYWILRKERWGLIRMKIDDDGKFVSADKDVTPGVDEEFFFEGTPGIAEIAAKIWLTTALFPARALYPSGVNSTPLSARPDGFPFWAIGRVGDFIRNASESLAKSQDGHSNYAAGVAYEKFLNFFPVGEVERILRQVQSLS